jgi:hypothetical protein
MKLSFFDSVELVVIDRNGAIEIADLTSLIDRDDSESESDEEPSKLGAELSSEQLRTIDVKNSPSLKGSYFDGTEVLAT